MSSELSETLAKNVKKESGAPANGYKDNPWKGMNFVVNTYKNKELKLWRTGKAEVVDLKGNRRHNQVILDIHEPASEFVEKIHSPIYAWTTSRKGSKVGTEVTNENILNQSTIFIPGAKREVYTGVWSQEWTDGRKANGSKYREVEGATVTHKAPERNLHLLCGIDEVAPFICALPEKADSVEHAHEILRPKNVPEGSLRQGEFFFLPVEDDKLINTLNSRLTKKNSYGVLLVSQKTARPLEVGSTHTGLITDTIDKKLYVAGMVFDTRSTRHAPLMLPNWHEVVRNTEIVLPKNINRSRVRWD